MAGQSEKRLRFGHLGRLHQAAEFAAVMSSRTRICAGCFELRYLLQRTPPAGGGARLGLIIPKRLAKRAVLRNLLKRVARESFRNMRHALPPADVVLRLAKPPLTIDQRVTPALRSCWRKSIDELLAGLRSR